MLIEIKLAASIHFPSLNQKWNTEDSSLIVLMIRSRYKLLKWFLINIYKCSSSSLPLVISTQNRSRYLGWLHINFKSEFCEQSRNILNEIFSISSPKMLAVKWRVGLPTWKIYLQSSQKSAVISIQTQIFLWVAVLSLWFLINNRWTHADAQLEKL